MEGLRSERLSDVRWQRVAAQPTWHQLSRLQLGVTQRNLSQTAVASPTWHLSYLSLCDIFSTSYLPYSLHVCTWRCSPDVSVRHTSLTFLTLRDDVCSMCLVVTFDLHVVRDAIFLACIYVTPTGPRVCVTTLVLREDLCPTYLYVTQFVLRACT